MTQKNKTDSSIITASSEKVVIYPSVYADLKAEREKIRRELLQRMTEELNELKK